MRRYFVGTAAALLLVAAFILGAVAMSGGWRSTGADPSASGPVPMQSIAGPVDGGKLPGTNGGHVPCPNNQPCGETGSARP